MHDSYDTDKLAGQFVINTRLDNAT
jgi:hypothetical protein